MIDIGAHLAGAARAPGPDGRRHIVDNRHERLSLADALGDRMGEFGAVDNDDAVGLRLQPGIHGLIDAPDELGQACQDRQRPHDSHVRQGEDRAQPLGFHHLPADAGEQDRGFRLCFKRCHKLTAEVIPGMLARDDKYAARSWLQLGLL